MVGMPDILDAIVPTAPQILPGNTPFLTPAQMHIYQTEQPYMARDGIPMTSSGRSPPPTDSEPERHSIITPASNAASTHRPPAEASSTMAQHADSMWDAYPMPAPQQQFNMDSDFEVSQWLEFPAEGVSNSDEAMIDSMFSSNEAAANIGDHQYAWTKSSHPHSQQTIQQFQHNMREIDGLTMMGISTAGQAA